MKSEKSKQTKKSRSSGDLKGIEKQSEMKSDQVQKELDKGSEKGKAAREANSKKWWKIWED
jgi:hypothetical protein